LKLKDLLRLFAIIRAAFLVSMTPALPCSNTQFLKKQYEMLFPSRDKSKKAVEQKSTAFFFKLLQISEPHILCTDTIKMN